MDTPSSLPPLLLAFSLELSAPYCPSPFAYCLSPFALPAWSLYQSRTDEPILNNLRPSLFFPCGNNYGNFL